MLRLFFVHQESARACASEIRRYLALYNIFGVTVRPGRACDKSGWLLTLEGFDPDRDLLQEALSPCNTQAFTAEKNVVVIRKPVSLLPDNIVAILRASRRKIAGPKRPLKEAPRA